MAISKSKTEREKIAGEYREFIKKRILKSGTMMALTKASVGDFSGKIKLPKEEDELGELIIAVHLTLTEMRALDELKKKAEKARRIAEMAEIKTLTETRAELDKKVKERTKELQERVDELEKFHKLTVGRELKMVELKEEIERLKEKLEEYKG